MIISAGCEPGGCLKLISVNRGLYLKESSCKPEYILPWIAAIVNSLFL